MSIELPNEYPAIFVGAYLLVHVYHRPLIYCVVSICTILKKLCVYNNCKHVHMYMRQNAFLLIIIASYRKLCNSQNVAINK